MQRATQRPVAIAAAWLLAAAVSLAAFMAVPGLRFGVPVQANVVLHTLWETVSIVVSGLVFSAGMMRLGGRGSDAVTAASAGFLAVAILDFLHVLSYEGMPDFVTPSGSGKAIVFFLAARLTAAVGMIAVAVSSFPSRPGAMWSWLAGSLAFAAVVAVAGFDVRVRAWFFIPGEGLTTLKVACEYALAALYAGAAAMFLARVDDRPPFPVVHFFTASGLMAISELCLSLYTTAHDQYSNLGHFWKVVAYLFLYRALLIHVVHRPFVELQQAHAALDAANATLEERVRERTAELESTNRDLEAFSYSVAHDLRAPLHAISGFAGALDARVGDRLEPAEHRFLSRIRENAATMGEMIDALLELARLARQPPRVFDVDLSALAAEVADDLRRADPSRAAAVHVEPGLQVAGDPALLRTALQNLLGNAWKFTADRGTAAIEFGALARDGERVFFVRDNGEGFDMADAPRLFGLFQRLHPRSAFGGHGIGLVNVRRIVTMHGGRVWAEAEPGRGATFYFTLPERAA